MARHSHWAQIKLKKGALDKKRGKIFTKHAHLIETAARQAGGDPNMNASLRLAIDNARADNMPRENIDRAIKKGTEELQSEQTEEISYEGYGPGGVAFVVETITNNKNRTSQIVRTIFTKHGGNMGSAGSTSFLFEQKGMIEVKKEVSAETSSENDELYIIDSGAQDLEKTDDGFVVYTRANEVGAVRKVLEEKGFSVQSAKLTLLPKNITVIEDLDAAQKLMKLVEALEDEEDVSNVAASFEIAERIVNEL